MSGPRRPELSGPRRSEPSGPRRTDVVSGPRRTGPRHLLPADRRMLHAVRDTLSHVRRPVTSTSPRHDVETPPQSQNWSYVTAESLTAGGGVQNCSRLHYNKKAMDEIRQSLENYHVSESTGSSAAVAVAATTHLTNGTTASDNMVRQVILLGANEVCIFTITVTITLQLLRAPIAACRRVFAALIFFCFVLVTVTVYPAVL